jgi:HPt (histidine-containing phosphotransfer) domain-containing protein
MDGLEASAKIIELNTGIPIIAMTANVMSSDRELYTENGMSDCVGKPFTSQELWRCLLKYLAPVNKDNTGKNMNTKSDSLLEKDIKFQRCLEKSFVKSNLRKYEEITAALESGDIKLAHRLAHTLKGNAGQLGKTSLQKAAADVEKNLSNGKNQVTPEQMTMLDTELKNVLEQLEAEFKLVPGLEADDRSQSAEPLDTKSARELIEKLEPMLKMGNPECCNFTDCICRIPGGMELAQQIEDFDFDHAITTLDEIKKELEKQQV